MPLPTYIKDTQNIIEKDDVESVSVASVTPSESLQYHGGGLSVRSKSIQSQNFIGGAQGWGLSSIGDVQMNGNILTSAHFTKVFSAKNVSFYVSDGTTPNGNLSGNAGDVCFGADSGNAYKCTSGTTWVSFT